MADINDEFQRAEAEAARALQRLAAVAQSTAGAFGNATSTVKASAQSVGQGLVRLRADLDRGRVSYKDAAQALRHLEAQFESLDDATRSSAAGARMADQQKRIGAELFRNALGDISADLAKVGIASVLRYQINQLSTGVKAIQENAGGMQMSFQLQNQALTDQIAILGKFETALQQSATALAAVPNPYARAAAVVAGVGSGLLGLLSAAKELQLKGFAVIQTELLKSQESFKTMTGAGALFADGVTEIRTIAALTQLDLKELSVVTAQNADIFARLGGSVADGVKRFAAVNSALKNNRDELLNLGYTYEQQAQASIDFMDRLQQSGQLLNQTPEQLAKETAEYVKHLKAVSSLTGEDEKRLKQRQQQAREQAAVQALLRQTGGDAAQKFDDLIGQFPGYEKAIQQLFAVGEVTDPVLATVLANNQELDQALRQGVENVRNNNVDARSAQQENEKFIRLNADALKRNADEFGAIAGTVALVNGGLQGQADLSMLTYRTAQRAGEAQRQGADLSLDAVEKLSRTNDALTREMSRAEQAFRDTASAFNRDITPMITKFAVEGLGGFKGLAATIKEADEKIREAVQAFTKLTVGGARTTPAQERARERDQRIERETPGLGPRGDEYRSEPVGINRRARPEAQLAQDLTRESAPVSMSLVSLTEDSSNRFKDSFVQAMVSYQQQRAASGVAGTNNPDALATVTDTLKDAFSGQNGFNQAIVGLKDQISTDNSKQIAVLQKQADKLENLIDAMQATANNTERMARELA